MIRLRPEKPSNPVTVRFPRTKPAAMRRPMSVTLPFISSVPPDRDRRAATGSVLAARAARTVSPSSQAWLTVCATPNCWMKAPSIGAVLICAVQPIATVPARISFSSISGEVASVTSLILPKASARAAGCEA